jgi:hypothetical protein
MKRPGSSYQRQAIAVYLRARGTAETEIQGTIDRVVVWLDSNAITPERFRSFSYPALRNAIETALDETGGSNGIFDN